MLGDQGRIGGSAEGGRSGESVDGARGGRVPAGLSKSALLLCQGRFSLQVLNAVATISSLKTTMS